MTRRPEDTERLDSLSEMLCDWGRSEIRHLREIEAWAYAQQPFKDGDQVVIQRAPNIEKPSGWWSSREFLVEGSTGVILDVYFITDHWGVLFKPDVQWVTSDDYGHRFQDRPSSFYFDPARLRLRKKKDRELTIPADTQEWSYKRKAMAV